MKRIIFFLLVPMVFSSVNLFAQDGNNPMSYSNLALQFNNSTINGDAASGFFPSVASANGFGSYLDNPASVGLMEESSFSFGLLNSNTDLQSTYLGNSWDSKFNNTNLSNLGFVYNFPTQQGSFVIGGGYSLHTSDYRMNQLNARNNESTITDFFNNEGSGYNDLAFNTFAIDYATTDSSFTESIFRIGFADFPGITQDARIDYSTNIGEYSLFFGTEFQRNLYVGFSAGLTAGNYVYHREFLEIDEFNDYDGDFIEGTDINQILTYDEIDADILAFAFRAGLIYKINSNINLGLSYLLPSTLNISEYYFSSIETHLDDGSTPFYDETGNEYDDDYHFTIRNPGKLNLGFALNNFNGLSLSAAAEIIDYSNSEIDLVSSEDFDYIEETGYREDQIAINREMAENYNMVINLRAGMKYTFNEYFELRGGYAYYPAKSDVYEADKNIISGGFGVSLSESFVLNFSTQYSFWNDQTEAYSYYDGSGQFQQETISESINRWNILAGIKINF